MKRKVIDMWYGDPVGTADKIDISFYPADGTYRGNIWKGGKAIGDYICPGSLEVERLFPQLVINWDNF